MIWVLHLSTWLPGSLRRDWSWQSGLGWVGRGSQAGIKGIGFHYLQDVWCWLGNANTRGYHHCFGAQIINRKRKAEFEFIRIALRDFVINSHPKAACITDRRHMAVFWNDVMQTCQNMSVLLLLCVSHLSLLCLALWTSLLLVLVEVVTRHLSHFTFSQENVKSTCNICIFHLTEQAYELMF